MSASESTWTLADAEKQAQKCLGEGWRRVSSFLSTNDNWSVCYLAPDNGMPQAYVRSCIFDPAGLKPVLGGRREIVRECTLARLAYEARCRARAVSANVTSACVTGTVVYPLDPKKSPIDAPIPYTTADLPSPKAPAKAKANPVPEHDPNKWSFTARADNKPDLGRILREAASVGAIAVIVRVPNGAPSLFVKVEEFHARLSGYGGNTFSSTWFGKITREHVGRTSEEEASYQEDRNWVKVAARHFDTALFALQQGLARESKFEVQVECLTPRPI